MIDKLKQDILQSMQTQSHTIKYNKQLIESAVRNYRDKTSGDIWSELIEWYDFMRELTTNISEIKQALIAYRELHNVLELIHKNEIFYLCIYVIQLLGRRFQSKASKNYRRSSLLTIWLYFSFSMFTYIRYFV